MTTSPTQLEQLIEQALDAIDRGEAVDVGRLCDAHPELRADLTAALQQVTRLPVLHRAASTIDPLLGSQLGDRYRLIERIGAGAMGVVYSGFDRTLGRTVAVKVLRPELVVGARMDKRLVLEGQVLASIRHPSVVTVHDSGKAVDGRAYLVMERLHGCSLSQLLRAEEELDEMLTSSGRLTRFQELLGAPLRNADSDVRLVVGWIADAAAGVQAAHDVGVVHRDIKPSNLLLERDGRLVVLDFGIVSSGSHGTIGSDGSPLGTPAYMAPEQLSAEIAPTVRTDVYGLAATLYHLLAGRPPFRGSLQEVLGALPHREPPRLDDVRPGLPLDLIAIVEQGMAKQPSRRYPSAAAFRADLLAWLEHRPVSARRLGFVAAMTRRLWRSPRARTGVAVLLLVAGAAGVWSWQQGRRVEREQRYAAAWAQLPPVLINDLPNNRPTNSLRRDPKLTALLDEMLATAPDPRVVHAIYAIHHSDCGDLAAAANDADRIAQAGDAPFAVRAAAEYRAGRLPDALAQGKTAPEVGGVGDRFLVVLHAMRKSGPKPDWVHELLTRDDGLQRHVGFAEVHLLLQQRRDLSGQGAVGWPERVEIEATRLEVARGGRSAASCHVLTNALLRQGRFTEAMQVAQYGTELAPADSTLWLLRGSAANMSRKFPLAVAALRRSLELQPRSVHAHELLCDALLGEGRFDEAEQLWARTPFDAVPGGDSRRALQQGLIAFDRAQAQRKSHGGTDTPEVTSLLQVAKQSFVEGRGGDTEAPPRLEELLCRIQLGETTSHAALLGALCERSLSGELLEWVANALAANRHPIRSEAVAELLRAQAAELGTNAR